MAYALRLRSGRTDGRAATGVLRLSLGRAELQALLRRSAPYATLGRGALDAVLDRVPLDIIQLHGSETPARVAEVKARTGLPVMKAVGISVPSDLDALWDYGLVADLLLVDAKAPPDAALPGGNGLSFDWRLLAGRRLLKPWMLAGGLTPANVAEAVRLTGASVVDVSSGVEAAPGQKDPALIRDFVMAAQG